MQQILENEVNQSGETNASAPAVSGVVRKNRSSPPCTTFSTAAKDKKPVRKTYIYRKDKRQAIACRLVAKHYLTTGKNLHGSSVIGCQRWKNYGQPLEAVMEVCGSHAEMQGHFRCGAGWTCEVCAARITASNRSWIRAGAMPALDKHNLGASMITLTLAHTYATDWKATTDRLHDAYKTFDRRMGKWYKTIGSWGKMKALEATITRIGGLHPHFHVLVTHRKDCPADLLSAFADYARAAWSQAVEESGGNCNSHGFDFLENGLAEYLQKKAVAHEMANINTKTSRSGMTMPQLLDRYDRATGYSGDDPVLIEREADAQQAGQEWLRAVEALGGRTRFNAGGLSKKLGIKPPSEWEDIEYEEEKKAAAVAAEDQIITRIEYPLDDHVTATDNISGRPALAMMKRAAVQGGKGRLLNMVRALCEDVREKRSAFYRKPPAPTFGKSLHALGQEDGMSRWDAPAVIEDDIVAWCKMFESLPVVPVDGADELDAWYSSSYGSMPDGTVAHVPVVPVVEPVPVLVETWAAEEVPDWW